MRMSRKSLFYLPLAPHPVGQIEFTTPGIYNWTCPPGVTKVHVVCIGGGGGGYRSTSSGAGAGGGGLGWKNNIPVVPGTTYTIVVGAGGAVAGDGGESYFISNITVCGKGGGKGGATTAAGAGGTYVGDGGGNGGAGGVRNSATVSGGGGAAGGYSGNGGDGASANATGGTGVGGAAGGGSRGASSYAAGAGGGTGIYGQGSNGSGATTARNAGQGGSGGTPVNNTTRQEFGGNYGGGGPGSDSNRSNCIGGDGAVRIIWGEDRAFPSTNTENMIDPNDFYIGWQSITEPTSTYAGSDQTIISLESPAIANRIAHTFEIYAATNMTGVKIASFYQTSTGIFSTRDYITIGNVSAGSTQSFPISLNFNSGDYVGIYYATGTISRNDNIPNTGTYYKAGSNIPTTATTFSLGGANYQYCFRVICPK